MFHLLSFSFYKGLVCGYNNIIILSGLKVCPICPICPVMSYMGKKCPINPIYWSKLSCNVLYSSKGQKLFLQN